MALQRLIVSLDKPVVVRAYGAVRAGGTDAVDDLCDVGRVDG